MKNLLALALLLLTIPCRAQLSVWSDNADIFATQWTIGADRDSIGRPTRTANTIKEWYLLSPTRAGSSTWQPFGFTDDASNRKVLIGTNAVGVTDIDFYTGSYASAASRRLNIGSSGTVTTYGNAVIGGTLLPDADGTRTLGSSAASWSDIWADGDIYAGQSGAFRFGSGRTRLDSSANGFLSIRTASAGNMSRVLFGTADSSGPALSFSGTTIRVTDGAGTRTALEAGSIELGAASDTTLARSAAGKITVESVPVALAPAVETLSYSGSDVTVTAGKGPLQRSQLTAAGNFNLLFASGAQNDAGTIYVAPAATNCTVTLPSYAFGPSGSTLTITGGTGNTNFTKIAWEIDVIGGTNRVSINALNYYR